MTEKEILEGNLLIAEFMKVDFSLPYMWRPGAFIEFTVDHLTYHKSWDWLMPVVEKIESLYYEVYIDGCSCEISTSGYEWVTHCECLEKTKIKATYKACIEFIKQYNTETLRVAKK